MLIDKTPIEEYKIGNEIIFVKRDDLFGQYPAPPLAKLRGARVVLKRLKEEGIKTIGVYDTSVSKAGQGIAFLCKEYGMECIIGFPLKQGSMIADSKLIAQRELGAKLEPLTAGMTSLCYQRFKKQIIGYGGYMMPLGLVCRETVDTVRQVSTEAYEQVHPKTIIVSTGTGTIATGVSLGSPEARVCGISCGMSPQLQWGRVSKIAYPDFIYNLGIYPPKYGYYDKLDTSKCPFPTSPYYDMKAWEWLTENIEKLAKPILFWNIGV